MQWLSTVRAGHWLVKGVVGHGDDRLKEGRKEQGQKCVVLDGTLFFACLLVCGQSTRSIVSDLEGALKQARYMHHLCITPHLKSEKSIFEGLIKKACASSGELELATSLKYFSTRGLELTRKRSSVVFQLTVHIWERPSNCSWLG